MRFGGKWRRNLNLLSDLPFCQLSKRGGPAHIKPFPCYVSVFLTRPLWKYRLLIAYTPKNIVSMYLLKVIDALL